KRKTGGGIADDAMILRKPVQRSESDQRPEGETDAEGGADQSHAVLAPLRRGAVGDHRLSRSNGGSRHSRADPRYEQQRQSQGGTLGRQVRSVTEQKIEHHRPDQANEQDGPASDA